MSKFVPVPTHTLKLASRALRTVTASNGKVVWFQDGKLQALDPNDKFKILISVFVACPPNAAMPTYFCTLSIAERFLAINGSNEPFLQDRTQYFFQGLALPRSIVFVCLIEKVVSLKSRAASVVLPLFARVAPFSSTSCLFSASVQTNQ